MRAVLIHRVVEVKPVTTKYGDKYIAELEVSNEGKVTYWLSPKQGQKLVDCANNLKDGYSTKRAELHVVLDDSGEKDRFVWCGIHSPSRSDIDYLQSQFGVVCESPYIGFQVTYTEAHLQLADD